MKKPFKNKQQTANEKLAKTLKELNALHKPQLSLWGKCK